MKNYRAGFSVGSSVGRHLKKGVERLKEHAAKKEAKKVQAGKDKIQKSEMGYAEGGRTGLKKGGPKPGTHDYFLLHKREKKAGGGNVPELTKLLRGLHAPLKQTVKKVAKKIKAKKDTESVKDVR